MINKETVSNLFYFLVIILVIFCFLSLIITTDSYTNIVRTTCIENNYTEYDTKLGIYPFTDLTSVTCWNWVFVYAGGRNNLLKGEYIRFQINKEGDKK